MFPGNRLFALALTGLLLGALAAPASARPPGPPPEGPGGPGGPRGPAGMGMLLRMPEVQEELALTDEQLMQLRELGEEMRERFRGRMEGRRGGRRGGPNGPPEERRRGPRAEGERPPRERPERGDGDFRGKMRERMQEARAEVEGRLAEVLSTEQMTRLKQLGVQHQLQRGGPRALMHGEVSDALQLSEDQRGELRDQAHEVREEMATKIRELRKAGNEQLLNVLTTEQRATLDGMAGEPFDFPPPAMRGPRGEGPEGDRPPRRGRRGEGRRGPPRGPDRNPPSDGE